jgi:hypothetical protein
MALQATARREADEEGSAKSFVRKLLSLAVAGGLEAPATGLTTPRLSRYIRGYLLSSAVYLGLDLSAHVRKHAN